MRLNSSIIRQYIIQMSCRSALVIVLRIISNKSLIEGIFPDMWKFANLVTEWQ